MTNIIGKIPTGRRATTLYATHSGTSPRAAARDVGPVVYAIRMKDGIIKIGHTTSIYERALALGGLNALLALRAGTLDDEQAIHRALQPYRARAIEYYYPVPEVLAVVNEMRVAMQMDPITS